MGTIEVNIPGGTMLMEVGVLPSPQLEKIYQQIKERNKMENRVEYKPTINPVNEYLDELAMRTDLEKNVKLPEDFMERARFIENLILSGLTNEGVLEKTRLRDRLVYGVSSYLIEK